MCEKNAIRIETSRNQIKRLKVPKWLKHGAQNEPTKIDQNGSFFWTINEESNGPKQIHHWMISFVRNHLGIRAISDQLTSMSQVNDPVAGHSVFAQLPGLTCEPLVQKNRQPQEQRVKTENKVVLQIQNVTCTMVNRSQ